MQPRLSTNPGENVSSSLIRALLLLNLATLLFFIPYPALLRVATTGPGPGDWWRILVVALAIPVGIAATVLRRVLLRRRNTRFYADTVQIDLHHQADMPPELQRVVTLVETHKIDIRVQGNLLGIEDPGGPIITSPRAVEIMNGRNVVILPALAWSRLVTKPTALAAVLAHEIAHIARKDLHRLLSIALLQRSVTIVTAVLTLFSISTSVWNDLDGSADIFGPFFVSLIGKGSYLAAVLLLIAGVAIARIADACREALADDFAISLAGRDALESATTTLSALPEGSIHLSRPWADISRTEMALGSPLIFLLGISTGALANYIGTPFAYVCNVSPESSACKYSSIAFGSLETLTIFLGCYPICTAITRLRPSAGLRSSAFLNPLIPFVLGVITAVFVTQVLPLMATALPIFDRFRNIRRHDALPLLLANLANDLVLATSMALLAGIAARAGALTRTSHGWAVWISIVLMLGIIEAMLFPSMTKGAVYPLLLGATLVAAAFSTRHVDQHPKPAQRPALVFLVAVTIFAGGWVGLGGASTLAIAWNRAGLAMDPDAGLPWLEAAAEISRFSPEGWLSAARVACNTHPGSIRAVRLAQHAVDAPYLHAWSEQLQVRVLAAACLLEGPDSNSQTAETAERHLAVARDLWERNVALAPTLGAATMLYSAIAQLKTTSDVLAATMFLADAVAIDPANATEMVENRELASLAILQQKRPLPETIAHFQSIRGESPSALARVGLQRGLNPEEIRKILCLYIISRLP